MSVIDLSALCGACCGSSSSSSGSGGGGGSSGSGGCCGGGLPSTVYLTCSGGPGGWASSYTLTETSTQNWVGSGPGPCASGTITFTLFCVTGGPYLVTITDYIYVSGTLFPSVISCDPFLLGTGTLGFITNCPGNYFSALSVTVTE